MWGYSHRVRTNGTFVLREKVSIDLDQRSVRIGLLDCLILNGWVQTAPVPTKRVSAYCC
jgi:hypothetical protein